MQHDKSSSMKWGSSSFSSILYLQSSYQNHKHAQVSGEGSDKKNVQAKWFTNPESTHHNG